MYENAITKISRSIFPVFYKLSVNGLTTVGISGTAFFINDEGHFITATHVTTDIPSGAKLLYAGNLPFSALEHPIEIEEVYKNDLKYIYVGKVSKSPLPGLKFTEHTSVPGKAVCLSGYPLAELLINPDESVNLGNVRQYWKPTIIIDSIEAAINHGTQNGFITEHSSLNGMNGGPVFDGDGDVCGMDITTFLREIPEPKGGKTYIRNGVVIGTINMRDLIPDYISLS